MLTEKFGLPEKNTLVDDETPEIKDLARLFFQELSTEPESSTRRETDSDRTQELDHWLEPDIQHPAGRDQ